MSYPGARFGSNVESNESYVSNATGSSYTGHNISHDQSVHHHHCSEENSNNSYVNISFVGMFNNSYRIQAHEFSGNGTVRDITNYIANYRGNPGTLDEYKFIGLANLNINGEHYSVNSSERMSRKLKDVFPSGSGTVRFEADVDKRFKPVGSKPRKSGLSAYKD